jgi:hypothetical protein
VETYAGGSGQALDGRQRGVDPVGHVTGGDEPEVVGRQVREQRHGDIGRRGSAGDPDIGQHLNIVRRQRVMFVRRERVEVGPRLLRHGEQVRPVGLVEHLTPDSRRAAHDKRNGRCGQPDAQQGQRRRER